MLEVRCFSIRCLIKGFSKHFSLRLLGLYSLIKFQNGISWSKSCLTFAVIIVVLRWCVTRSLTNSENLILIDLSDHILSLTATLLITILFDPSAILFSRCLHFLISLLLLLLVICFLILLRVFTFTFLLLYLIVAIKFNLSLALVLGWCPGSILCLVVEYVRKLYICGFVWFLTLSWMRMIPLLEHVLFLNLGASLPLLSILALPHTRGK